MTFCVLSEAKGMTITMKRIVRFSEKIKYLGLFGLLGLILDHPFLNFLWLFWLFGLVSIFDNPGVFLQSLKQLRGILTVSFRYGSHQPSTENYRGKVQYSLPFKGAWTVVNGGVDKASSHSWQIQPQRYAYDFVMLDEEGHSFSGEHTSLTAYYCYSKEILAPAEGEVVEVKNKYPDSELLGGGQADCSASDIRGNYILIRHADQEYGLLAHLQPGSVRVRVGDRVSRGQSIASCGNSGNTSEPHLHFHVQNGMSFYLSVGLPIEFTGITNMPAPHYSSFDPRPVPSAHTSAPQYILRGHRVSNT